MKIIIIEDDETDHSYVSRNDSYNILKTLFLTLKKEKEIIKRRIKKINN